MNPSRKRSIRLIVTLTAALSLVGVLLYTTFSGGTEIRSPSGLVNVRDKNLYEVSGVVVQGSVQRDKNLYRFTVRDRKDDLGRKGTIHVQYQGPVPDPFREGREIVVKVKRRGSTFVGEHGSLITKCPSKFAAEKA